MSPFLYCIGTVMNEKWYNNGLNNFIPIGKCSNNCGLNHFIPFRPSPIQLIVDPF
jgi:hypothetical protein